MSETYWRSPVDLPRDGRVIALIFRDEPAGIVRCESLMFGEIDVEDVPTKAWFCGGEWNGLFDWASSLDPKIIGWHPLPQLNEWDPQP